MRASGPCLPGLAGASTDPWPTPLSVHIGAGYEPATALMPVLTLPWEVALLAEAAVDGSRSALHHRRSRRRGCGGSSRRGAGRPAGNRVRRQIRFRG